MSKENKYRRLDVPADEVTTQWYKSLTQEEKDLAWKQMQELYENYFKIDKENIENGLS